MKYGGKMGKLGTLVVEEKFLNLELGKKQNKTKNKQTKTKNKTKTKKKERKKETYI